MLVLKPGSGVGVADDDHAALLWEPATPVLRQCQALMSRVLDTPRYKMLTHSGNCGGGITGLLHTACS